MENNDFGNDDFLRRLIQQSPLDHPSEDFVDRVMAGIHPAPEIAPVQRPFLQYLQTLVPYAFLIFILFVVFSTSDLPFLNWLPGKNYLIHSLISSFGSLFAGLKYALTSKYVSFGLLIITSTCVLFLIDRLLSRKTTV